MFDHLVESRPHREGNARQALASIAVHTVIIAASIQLTRAMAATVTKAPPASEMILARAPTPAARHNASVSAAPILLAAPVRLAVASPITVPVGIAPVELMRGFDPARIGQPSDAHGLPLGLGDDDTPSDPRFLAALRAVDEPAEYLDGPQPKYPPALRRVGIEGWVQLRFIVGLDGHAEPRSIETLKSSNPSFEAPAIEAIQQSRFKPARIMGRKVRQLVEQLVRFALR